jgi:hypothetical protein
MAEHFSIKAVFKIVRLLKTMLFYDGDEIGKDRAIQESEATTGAAI